MLRIVLHIHFQTSGNLISEYWPMQIKIRTQFKSSQKVTEDLHEFEDRNICYKKECQIFLSFSVMFDSIYLSHILTSKCSDSPTSAPHNWLQLVGKQLTTIVLHIMGMEELHIEVPFLVVVLSFV